MSKVSLLGTDVRKVDFVKIEWPDKLLDERVSKDYPLVVEKLYRELKHNYEDRHNYPKAGHFYYGEMEMRRKDMPRARRWFFSLTALYYQSSGYGQLPGRALWRTVELILFFSLFYMCAGLRLEAGYKQGLGPMAFPGPSDISWSIVFPPIDTGANLQEFGRQFWYAGLHTLQVLTFSRIRTYTALNWQGEFLIVLQTILLPLQVALLALAVRRRFQR